jgi:hypothetical protein
MASFSWLAPAIGVSHDVIPAVELSLAILLFLAEFVGIVCVLRGRHYHVLSRQGFQRALLIDALGETHEPVDVSHLRQRFGNRLMRKADASPTSASDYYSSPEPSGRLERLRDNLQETAFFSTSLYWMAAWRLFSWLLVPMVAILVFLFALPLFGGKTAITIARALIAGVVFFALSDTIAQVFACFSASSDAGNVDRRLENIDPTRYEPLMAAFTDYQVAAAAAPPIPKSLYARNRERLKEEWKRRQR